MDTTKEDPTTVFTSPAHASGHDTQEVAVTDNPFRDDPLEGSTGLVTDHGDEAPAFADPLPTVESLAVASNGDGGDDEPPAEGDDESEGDPKGKPNWFVRFLIAAAVILVLLVAWRVLRSDDQPDEQPDQASVETTAAGDFANRVLCDFSEPVHLSAVGVLKYGDSLYYEDVTPFTGGADTESNDALRLVLNDLFVQDGDGCTPAGTAYWRNILPHAIDADRLGVSNHDASIRIPAYEQDTAVHEAVIAEIARHLNQCSVSEADSPYQTETVYLTETDSPMIYVAAYTVDYRDVVFVHTPLITLDTLPSGEQGLAVTRCRFGKSEGGGHVNEILISRSLRSIVYLDRPTGAQVIGFVPDTVDQPEDPSDQPEELTDSADQEAAQPPDQETQQPSETQTPEVNDEATQQQEVDVTVSEEPVVEMPAETPEEPAETPEPTEADTPQDSPVETPDTPDQTDLPDAPEQTEQPEPEPADVPEPTAVEQPADTPQPERQQAEQENPAGKTDDGNQGDDGQTVSQPDPGNGGNGGCSGTCPGDGPEGPGDGDGGGSGGDSGDGDGDGPGTGPGGGGDDGDGPGGDQPPAPPTPEPEACPAGWIVDPFGNCKSPDPGSGGF